MGVAQTVKSWVTQFKCLFPFSRVSCWVPFFQMLKTKRHFSLEIGRQPDVLENFDAAAMAPGAQSETGSHLASATSHPEWKGLGLSQGNLLKTTCYTMKSMHKLNLCVVLERKAITLQVDNQQVGYCKEFHISPSV